jgi:hypothetical protein
VVVVVLVNKQLVQVLMVLLVVVERVVKTKVLVLVVVQEHNQPHFLEFLVV